MSKISHQNAVYLENCVRELFGCERYDVAGLVDADVFEVKPIIAAVLSVSYIYAKGLQKDNVQLKDFYCKYDYLFSNDGINDSEVQQYIEDLKSIIDSHI